MDGDKDKGHNPMPLSSSSSIQEVTSQAIFSASQQPPLITNLALAFGGENFRDFNLYQKKIETASKAYLESINVQQKTIISRLLSDDHSTKDRIKMTGEKFQEFLNGVAEEVNSKLKSWNYISLQGDNIRHYNNRLLSLTSGSRNLRDILATLKLRSLEGVETKILALLCEVDPENFKNGNDEQNKRESIRFLEYWKPQEENVLEYGWLDRLKNLKKRVRIQGKRLSSVLIDLKILTKEAGLGMEKLNAFEESLKWVCEDDSSWAINQFIQVHQIEFTTEVKNTNKRKAHEITGVGYSKLIKDCTVDGIIHALMKEIFRFELYVLNRRFPSCMVSDKELTYSLVNADLAESVKIVKVLELEMINYFGELQILTGNTYTRKLESKLNLLWSRFEE